MVLAHGTLYARAAPADDVAVAVARFATMRIFSAAFSRGLLAARLQPMHRLASAAVVAPRAMQAVQQLGAGVFLGVALYNNSECTGSGKQPARKSGSTRGLSTPRPDQYFSASRLLGIVDRDDERGRRPAAERQFRRAHAAAMDLGPRRARLRAAAGDAGVVRLRRRRRQRSALVRGPVVDCHELPPGLPRRRGARRAEHAGRSGGEGVGGARVCAKQRRRRQRGDFDANWVRRRLPSSIEAFFTVRPAFANKRCKSWCDALVRVASNEGWEASRCAAAASGGDQCDAYVRDVHRRWTVEYGANAAPLLVFDLGNWSAPFSVAQQVG